MKNILWFINIILALYACSPSGSKPVEMLEDAKKPEVTDVQQVQLNAAQIQMANIQLGEIEKKTVAAEIVCRGTLGVPPGNRYKITPPMPGFVSRINLLPGQAVRRGQVLLTLEHPEYIDLQSEYLKVKSQLSYQEKELARQKTLAEKNATAQKNFQKAEADFLRLKAELGGLSVKLKLLNIQPDQLSEEKISKSIRIYAPSSGYITRIHVSNGDMVGLENSIMEIVDKSHLHAELQVFERDLVHLKEGQEIQVQVANASLPPLKAFVKLVGQEIDGESKTVDVHAHLEEVPEILKPGMWVNATILSKAKNVWTLPEMALVRNQKEYFVYQENQSGSFEKVPVVIGQRQGDIVEVKEGIQQLEGKKVVIEGANYLEASLQEMDAE
ncbi:efflux RND transporter periplasmic adaptor subunit [Rapidithrix thailandica]|uniref:Efflux RND transporter periplasmic adaptor subunit n=1 Tax=Rapidithrix thailandica TaxID=413964 RepID=A0AAW9RZG7_9BACT